MTNTEIDFTARADADLREAGRPAVGRVDDTGTDETAQAFQEARDELAQELAEADHDAYMAAVLATGPTPEHAR